MYSVQSMSPDVFSEIACEAAALSSFGVSRSRHLDRIDFALIAMKDEKPAGYVTCLEMDADTIYWQIGGAFADAKKTGVVVPCYLAMIDWCLDRYHRITTRIENTNQAMLRLAMKVGFLIVGTWNFKGTIYLELLLEKGS